MSRSQLIQPIRHSLLRPLAPRPRNAFIGSVTRSMADIPKPEEKLSSLPGQHKELPVPFPMTNELLHQDEENQVRLPRSVQALYLQPLRREAEFGVPTCDLQLRSYSVPNLEFFCDFALRAAYYLHLPAFGPVPLPRITERWTVPKSSFIFKKSQENFERVTLRRLIQIRDGHPESVQIWLAFLQKHAYYGIGMKANVWEFSKIGVGKDMDSQLPSMQEAIDEKMKHLGRDKVADTVEKVKELLESERFRHRGGPGIPAYGLSHGPQKVHEGT
ncbi:ribosomal protein S10 domain-containing protein [Pseudomassariella vexata]|uniref:Small ribosomal subunit protein uS10m n=1 Tax=Pseudomassariella vexata TaxID=1141098 RepID=A0A1Y2EEG9_9PEZI|nr:ribosomal protein S10 domain-containing protein [Pseudomassariella vexata]ORY69666.1 ribosomal protein S10 domain-containing protein [Pseudomassariella vexata]